jgi:hypothetical protein
MLPLLVVHDFNVADQIADDFYTIEICSRDLRGAEVIFDSRYLFTGLPIVMTHPQFIGMRWYVTRQSVPQCGAVSKNLTVLQ